MKYMSFNNACGYAGIANMLEKYGVEVEDREIIQGASIPYLFHYDEQSGQYQAGAMLEGKQWVDPYLHTLGYELGEAVVSKEEVLNYFDHARGAYMIGIYVAPGFKHAILFEKKDGKEYVFFNNKHLNEDAPDYYRYTKEGLLERLDEQVAIAWIASIGEEKTIDLSQRFLDSLKDVDQCTKELNLFCESYQDYATLMKERDRLFRALLLEVKSMMEIIGEECLVRRIQNLLEKYMMVLRSKEGARLYDIFDRQELLGCLEVYRQLVQQQITSR